MKLSEVKLNVNVKVIDCFNDKNQKKRLLDMGITKGAIIKVIRKGILCPVEIFVKGTRIAIRKKEIEKIIVEEV